ncbi:MAG TPA: hypothetical protein VFI78_05090 [Salinimicrobium sp.]|nr:hypothetical protein [Salinimicrobium sp.]
MSLLQEHIPKEEPASELQEWGFSVWEFIVGNWIYLLAIVVILLLFLYARHRRRERFK